MLLLLLIDLMRLYTLLVIALHDDLREERLCILRLQLHDCTRVVIAPISDLHEGFHVVKDALSALLVQVLHEVLLQIVETLVALEFVIKLAICAILGANLYSIHFVQSRDVLLCLIPLIIDAIKYSLQKLLIIFALGHGQDLNRIY